MVTLVVTDSCITDSKLPPLNTKNRDSITGENGKVTSKVDNGESYALWESIVLESNWPLVMPNNGISMEEVK